MRCVVLITAIVAIGCSSLADPSPEPRAASLQELLNLVEGKHGRRQLKEPQTARDCEAGARAYGIRSGLPNLVPESEAEKVISLGMIRPFAFSDGYDFEIPLEHLFDCGESFPVAWFDDRLTGSCDAAVELRRAIRDYVIRYNLVIFRALERNGCCEERNR